MNYFTADLHFGHEKVISSCKRPYKNIYKMNEGLIYNINSLVGSDDDLYILGDISYNCSVEYVTSLVSKLNGRLHLLTGNHDITYVNNNRFTKLFTSINNDLTIIGDTGAEIFMSHIPKTDWVSASNNTIHAYAHYHYRYNPSKLTNNISFISGAYNVGVDYNEYRPINEEELCKRVYDTDTDTLPCVA